MASRSKKLPSAGPEREKLRVTGRFWTPDWVADAMVAYVLQDKKTELFDPAVGAGAFQCAAKRLHGSRIHFIGTEVDKTTLKDAKENGLTPKDLKDVQLLDFFKFPVERKFSAVIANPPYIRHHRLDPKLKAHLQQLAMSITGRSMDGRAGLHIYFLLKSLLHLKPNGRLAFLVPADICEGVFSSALWAWISQHYCLEACVTFSPEATPFPQVDTNALVLCLRKAAPATSLQWIRCERPDGAALAKMLVGGKVKVPYLTSTTRSLTEALRTGLSRPPQAFDENQVTLRDYARVVRGIATGANEFFFLTRKQAMEHGIPDQYFVPAIGRTRDVTVSVLREEDLLHLDERGRPTRLLNLFAKHQDLLPKKVQKYLAAGEKTGLHKKPLIATRKPWFRMEQRAVPPILFAYLGRRNVRFIRNLSGAIPLTGFLCVYPHDTRPESVDALCAALNHPDTLNGLSLIGKSYGGGAIKAEPRSLERLVISAAAIQSTHLPAPRVSIQLSLVS